MEENTGLPPTEYVDSFNNGYLIANHLPDLSLEIAKSLPESDRSKGLADGIRQWFEDKARDIEPEWSKENFHKAPKEHEEGKTKNSIDLDRD